MPTQKWTAPDSAVTVIDNTALSALANDAKADGSAVENATLLNQYATFEWTGQIASAPVADRTLDLYVQYAPDGTNWEDSTGARPSAMGLVGSFVLDNTASAQRKLITGVLLLPFRCRFQLVNKSGFALSGTNLVRMWTHNQAVN